MFNVIVFLTISITLFFLKFLHNDDESDHVQIFRIFKLARVLKLARHSPGLQVTLLTNRPGKTDMGKQILGQNLAQYFASKGSSVE